MSPSPRLSPRPHELHETRVVADRVPGGIQVHLGGFPAVALAEGCLKCAHGTLSVAERRENPRALVEMLSSEERASSLARASAIFNASAREPPQVSSAVA